jgi:spermidine synthase
VDCIPAAWSRAANDSAAASFGCRHRQNRGDQCTAGPGGDRRQLRPPLRCRALLEGIILLLGFTIFLSAFLLFLIEPLFAKLILPWFGGSAAVWTTCMVFFQFALLAGYLYAFGIARYLSARAQRMVHTALLASALLLLPLIPAQTNPGEHPVAKLLAILATVLGLPFFLLATTGPLLQVWSPKRSPYRLYALSNAGSLLALVAYPLLIEPNVPTRTQDIAWSIAFAIFAVLCALSAWTTQTGPIQSTAAPARSIATWFALATAGSMLLLSTTNQLTQNVAAVPFLWVLPLIVYLLTFILCFESDRWYRRGPYSRMLIFGFAIVAYTIYDIQLSVPIYIAVPVMLFGLFAGCMFCHGELAALKPEKQHLASFYVAIAAGGAAGALLVGLAAPAIFSGIYELAISMLVVSVLALWLGTQWSVRLLWSVATATTIAVIAAQAIAYHRNARVVTRDFYGSLRVVESKGTRRLYHGTIEHGSQALNRNDPTTYYGPDSGIGLALRLCCTGPKRVGIVGLGAGTLAAYGRTGDTFRYYEIDPEVIRIAQSQFTYLSKSAAKIDTVVGDARLSLAAEPPQRYNVLAIDAFSGDAIPVHLLTREAFELYRRHLAPGGILAIHISNQYLDLAPVVASLAPGARLVESSKDEAHDIATASWVLIGPLNVGQSIPLSSLRPWTDDYNNLLKILK